MSLRIHENCETNINFSDGELELLRRHYKLPKLPKDQLAQRIFDESMKQAVAARSVSRVNLAASMGLPASLVAK